MEPILEVKNLTVKYRKNGGEALAAVNDVSFYLNPGAILGIVGESGCGKSTVAKAIARLVDSTHGSVIFEGQDVTFARGAKRRQLYKNIQMVFQFPSASFDPGKTLGEGIGESLKNSGVKRKTRDQKVGELLLTCGLTQDFGKKYPHEVSGGQCQRAAIARALAPGPKLLICDEATSALDVTIQRQIMELLAGLQKKHGLAILFICHNLALVQSFCHRVIVMRRGAIVESGPVEQVLRFPSAQYTKDLIDAVL